VRSADELARLCKKWPTIKADAMSDTGVKLLNRHGPKVIAPQIIQWLESL
jgi:hypothetical protein